MSIASRVCSIRWKGIAVVWAVFAVACAPDGEGTDTRADSAVNSNDLPHFDPEMPADVGPEDTSPGWEQSGQRLLLTGRILLRDGVTPAPGVVLYYYHTNTEGRYVHDSAQPRSMPPDELGRTHGFIRGWVKTGADGRYAIRTVRPGAYPGGHEPAHVHATISEPGGASYYIDDFVFDDDALMTIRERKRREHRGGTGVVRLVRTGELFVGERDIILGLNVPGFAGIRPHTDTSGPEVGEDVPSFTPNHAWGPDRGSSACPMCKYGWYHGALYFIGERPDWNLVREWVRFLESESAARGKYLIACVVDGRSAGYDVIARTREWEALGRELGLERVALTFVPSFGDRASDVDALGIDASVPATLILYRRGRVIDKMLNPRADEATFAWFRRRLDESKGEYFDVSKSAN